MSEPVPPLPRRVLLSATAALLLPRVRPALADSRHYSVSGTASRREAVYPVPQVTLRDRFNRPVALRTLLAPGHAVVMEFFFTSCPTICGLQNSTLAVAQHRLVALSPGIRLVSISIDPGFDTPARIRRYAKPYAPLPNWSLLTGSQHAVQAVLSAFDATFPGGNKYLHEPLVYIRPANSPVWRRTNGLLTASQLVAEFRDVIAHTPPMVAAR
ncbi:MAG: SCO family protein [Acetobacteraceae bacterium]